MVMAMKDEGGEVLLNAAVNIGQYYAFLAQALLRVYNPETAAQLSDEVFNEQLDQIRKRLSPILEKNHVVKGNLERVDQEVMRIKQAAGDKATQAAAIVEAQEYHKEVAERARTVSDLVGLFRRL